jgi:branched-chain amino acid transport system ATP-binding protein
MPDPLLATHELDAFYGDFQALFAVSVELSAGEVIAIIGANGAGKSTLMRAITGLVPCRPGMVRLAGAAVGGLAPHRIAARGVAMVPEGRQLFASLTVEENLLIGAQLARPGPWSLGRIYELFPALAERRRMPAPSLSGGQQQMAAIGRALMANPELLLLDELSLGLAPIVIKAIYDALPTVIARGMSAIVVEQDIARAIAISDRIYCLREGRVSLAARAGDVSRGDIANAYFGA